MDMAVPQLLPCPQYLSMHGLPWRALQYMPSSTGFPRQFVFASLNCEVFTVPNVQNFLQNAWCLQNRSPIPLGCSEASLLLRVHGQAAKVLPGAC